MNLKFIEGGKAGYKVVEFGGAGVAYNSRKSSTVRDKAVEWVWWRKSIGVDVSE